MNYSGSIDFSERPLLEALFLSNKAEMMRCSDLHKSFPTPWGKKIVPALWVVTENAPLYVTRHLFRTTKLHSSRLDWCIFSHNRGGYERSTDPRPHIVPDRLLPQLNVVASRDDPADS